MYGRYPQLLEVCGQPGLHSKAGRNREGGGLWSAVVACMEPTSSSVHTHTHPPQG